MKKSVLLVLASAALMMAACGGNKPTPTPSSPTDTSEEGTSVVTSSEESSEEEVVYVESIEYISELTLEEGETHDFAVTVSPATAPQGVTITSSDDEVAYVESGVLVAGKAGTATLTITTEGVQADGTHLSQTATITVNKAVVPLPTAIDTDVDAIQSFTNSNENKIYSFSGILEGLDHNDAYGNAFITDPVSGNTVKVYGMTTTATVIAWNEAGTALEFKNPKDAKTTLADVNNGELVTVHGIYTSQYKNVSVILDKHETATTTYKAGVSEKIENGTVVLSKTEGIAYGEEITATVTPATDYKIDKVTIDHGFGKKDVLTAEQDGSYKFAAAVNNVIEATFVSSTAIVTELTLTVDSLGLASSAYGSVDSVVSGVSISVKDTGNYGSGIQMRGPTKDKPNNPPSYFYNTSATPYAIKSIKGVWNTAKTAPNYEWFACIAGAKDAAIDAAPNDANAVNVAANEGNIQLDFEETADIRYFTFGHSGTKGKGGTFYFSSVIVELYAPEA